MIRTTHNFNCKITLKLTRVSSLGKKVLWVWVTERVNMTLISLPHMVYYTLRFTVFFLFFFTTVSQGDVSHFQTSGTFTEKPYKKVHNILLVGLVVRFVQISSIYITSHWFKKVYWSWLRVQNKFHCKLPNKGCMRMFSLFPVSKQLVWLVLFTDPPSDPYLYSLLC